MGVNRPVDRVPALENARDKIIFWKGKLWGVTDLRVIRDKSGTIQTAHAEVFGVVDYSDNRVIDLVKDHWKVAK